MTDQRNLPQTAAFKNLRRLFWLRNVMVSGLGLAAWAAVGIYGLELPLAPISCAIGLLGLLNIATWWRLRQPRSAGDLELLAQLLLDMAALTALFYYTGGYSNPFVWMYLLPLTIAAVALPWRHTWLVAGLAVICYTALMFWYQPLPMMQMDMSGMSGDDMHMMHMQHQQGSGFTIHLLGMWAGFVVSAIVVAFFVERIGRNLREYDSLIAETREKALESERMLALGALATGAAHELGTPLATIAVLSKELAEEYADHAELAAQLGVMRQQVNRCKEIISSITASAGEARAEDGRPMALDQFLEQTVMRWRDMRPSVLLQCSMHGSTPAPIIAADRTLGQALVNLINNAADASPEKVEMEIGWTDTELHLQIRDYGPGLAPEMEPRVGTPFFTTKKNSGGLGLGIFLSKTIIERLGGTLRLGNRQEGGALTEVSLPLVKLILRKS